jgi:hypothetical protein
MPTGGHHARPEQVDVLGRVGGLFLYALSALVCLMGPAILATLVSADANPVAGIGFTVICTPLGIAIWCHTGVQRKQNRRLDDDGVAATAEILTMTEIAWGEDNGVALGLRVSGPGFETFETTWRRSAHPSLRVGLRLTAVVDPSDYLFRVLL